MLISAFIIIFLLSIFLLILYMGEKVKNSEYANLGEIVKNNELFRSERIMVTSVNRSYLYTGSTSELIYTCFLYKLTNNGDVEEVNVDYFHGEISINYTDFPNTSCIFGCVILKTTP